MKNPTLQDVAERAGVSKATVSRCLHGYPHIRPELRERVQQALKDLQYKPDPMVSRFLSQVRTSKVSGSGTVLGWINTYPEKGYWETSLRHPLFFGAKARCEALGLGLDSFWAGDPGLSPKRLVTILQARGIRGLILPPGSSPGKRLSGFDWSGFAVVEVNPTPDESQSWSCVGTDAHQNMRIMLEKLRAAAYRRIGLVLPRDFSARDGHGMLAEALLQRYLRSDGAICRPWLYEGDFMRPTVQTGFRRWLKQKAPDVLVCLDSRIRPVLEEQGLRIPEDLGLAHVSLGPDVQGWSGLNRHSEDKGTAAVDLLVDLLSRNQVGPTTDTRQLLTPGEWVQGETTSSRL